VPDVLRVAAIQIGNPVVILIFVKSNDGVCHVVGQPFQAAAAFQAASSTVPCAVPEPSAASIRGLPRSDSGRDSKAACPAR
jgi:hypothetical protein